MSVPEHPAPTSGSGGLKFSPWNLLLLIPLLMLATPLFNFDEPRVFGLPGFYWVQFLFVPVGVLCVGLVYVKTRHLGGRESAAADELDPADGADDADGEENR